MWTRGMDDELGWVYRVGSWMVGVCVGCVWGVVFGEVGVLIDGCD